MSDAMSAAQFDDPDEDMQSIMTPPALGGAPSASAVTSLHPTLPRGGASGLPPFQSHLHGADPHSRPHHAALLAALGRGAGGAAVAAAVASAAVGGGSGEAPAPPGAGAFFPPRSQQQGAAQLAAAGYAARAAGAAAAHPHHHPHHGGHSFAGALNSEQLAAAIAAVEYRQRSEAAAQQRQAAAAHILAQAQAVRARQQQQQQQGGSFSGFANYHPPPPAGAPHQPMLFGSRGGMLSLQGGGREGRGDGLQQAGHHQQQTQQAHMLLGRGGPAGATITAPAVRSRASPASPCDAAPVASGSAAASRGSASSGTSALPSNAAAIDTVLAATSDHNDGAPRHASANSNDAANAADDHGAGRNQNPVAIRMPNFSNGRPELPPPRWYDKAVPLGVADDKYYLSELQCVLRREFVEAFGTTQTDAILPIHGRNRPIALGQVGIRCQHCKTHNLPNLPVEPPPSNSGGNNNNNNANGNGNEAGNTRGNHRSTQNAVAYPSFISGIYNSVQQMYRLHFDQCPHIPAELKARAANLKDSHASNRGGRKQYWIDSAKRIGLVDTSFGVHYGRDPEDPLPPLREEQQQTTTMTNSSVGGEDTRGNEHYEWGGGRGGNHDQDESPEEGGGCHQGGAPCSSSYSNNTGVSLAPATEEHHVEFYPLVLPEDKPLICDYLYLALEQMQPCNLMDADRVGCYKGRQTGFPGLACKHCTGQAGCGRYFPATEASLSQTTTSQTIVNHVRNCRRCPLEVREQLELMKRAKADPDFKKSDKPKHGGRKVFFRRLWCRIQRIPLPKIEKIPSSDGPDKDKTTDTRSPEKKKRKRSADAAENENRKSTKRLLESKKDNALHEDPDSDEGDDVVETVEFDNVHEPPWTRPRPSTCAATEKSCTVVYRGRSHLNRGDDPHWLSEAECYIRRELTEVFTAQEEDLELSGDPELGQVGVRCFFCAENRAPADRHRGHVYYPSSVGAVQQAVADLQRRHLGMCSEIPEHIRESFRSMKGYGAKPKGDTTQYWIDALKELGLHDSHDGQGIYFFRSPIANSPADVFSDDAPTESVLVLTEDRNKCTDQMLLLLEQFKPCQFQMRDRRKSSRSRDRALGFPGLACIHCNQKRYFPTTEKKLQDSLILMGTHINNCFHAPLEVKASISYLHHRSLLQKQELPSQWKYTFLKRVLNRLQNSVAADGSGAEINVTTNGPGMVLEKKKKVKKLPDEEIPFGEREPLEEEGFVAQDGVTDNLLHDSNETKKQEHAAALEDMKDLIKSAALWLSERDAEYEARALRRRIRGNKRR